MNEGPGTTSALVGYARSIGLEQIPADALVVARTSILDWIGCALAGSREPLAGILAAEAVEQDGGGRSTLVGRGERTTPAWAALVNGAASHALDFDDTHLLMSGHPSVPVLPGLIALAESRNASGRDLLAAFVVGVETECRLGALLGLPHYAAGWHSTATLGTFGAAAACAHLLQLDEEGWLNAFGMAGVQASGLKSVFGTMSKPFQAGKASANGMLAATLAARGFTSATDIIETHQGFAETHAGSTDGKVLNRLKDRFCIRDTVFKYHASCYLTHSAMEAVLALRDRHKFAVEGVERVEVYVPRGSLDVCNITEPVTGLEGKFSLRATVAMALLGDDTADPAAFTDERMASGDLVAVRDLVTVHGGNDVAGTQSRVDIHVRGAKGALSETIDVGRPAPDADLQWDRLVEKFIRLAAPVVGEERAWAIHDRVKSLEDVADAAEFVGLCAG